MTYIYNIIQSMQEMKENKAKGSDGEE